MNLPKIVNLDIRKVTEDVLLIHQIIQPFFFSCSDGLLILPQKGRNKNTIVLDLNIEPHLVKSINKEYGPVSNYICSHGHLDHTCHVHAWEELGATINAPFPEARSLLDLHNFYLDFGFSEELDYHTVEEFAKLNGYQKSTQVKAFTPGKMFQFDNFKIETISFQGHSKAHIGFLLPREQVFHISCLGFDKPNLETEGFGPWYGFKEASISQYLEDINNAEEIFLQRARFLTSSHSYIVENPDLSPFEYMRKKIRNNQEKVDNALKDSNCTQTSENNAANHLLEMDLFFPKRKLEGVVFDVYRFWESWIIRKHIQRSKFFRTL